MTNEIELQYDEETGTWNTRKEPFATVEFQTEEDFERFKTLFKKSQKKKPYSKGDVFGKRCPTCDATIGKIMGNFCHHCGQALDWSDLTE